MGTFWPLFGVVCVRKKGEVLVTCEDDLIQRAACGDQEAFRQLWEAHHAIAMAAALRLCHHRSLAEDITQGTFLLAWRGLPRFQHGSPFRPWLKAVSLSATLARVLAGICKSKSLSVRKCARAWRNSMQTSGV